MKGMVTSTTATLVIVAIVLILVAAFMFFIYAYASEEYRELFNLGSEGVGSDIAQYAPSESLVDAIKCSYYRCAEGCDSSKIKNLEIDGKECECKNFDTNGDGKVCSEESRNHPVEVGIGEESKILKDYLLKIEQGICIGDTADNCQSKGAQAYGIFIDKNQIIKGEEEACGVRENAAHKPWYKQLAIKSGAYNVWTNEETILYTAYSTIVCSQSGSTIQSPTVSCKCIQTQPNIKRCIGCTPDKEGIICSDDPECM